MGQGIPQQKCKACITQGILNTSIFHTFVSFVSYNIAIFDDAFSHAKDKEENWGHDLGEEADSGGVDSVKVDDYPSAMNH